MHYFDSLETIYINIWKYELGQTIQSSEFIKIFKLIVNNSDSLAIWINISLIY